MREIKNLPISHVCILLPQFISDMQDYVLYDIATRLYSGGITNTDSFNTFINHELDIYEERFAQ